MQKSFAQDVATVGSIDIVPKLLGLVCRLTGLGFSAIARVTEDRWIACAVCDQIGFGLQPGGELQIETTICNEIRQSGELVVIDHVDSDPHFSMHPTPKMYGFQSYISVPIVLPDGRFFGTLCAFDPKPARIKSVETIDMFTLFANLIALHLDAQDRLSQAEAALDDERKLADIREQFVAILGHDLRNPLAAIQSNADLLPSLETDEQRRRAGNAISGSVTRMTCLIDNLLDFAQGRLGGGIDVTKVPDTGISAALEQVIEEARVSWPDRDIRAHVALNRPLLLDRARISQVLSNLLSNALQYGDANAPVTVSASDVGDVFGLSVTNAGPPVPPELLGRLFEPYVRSAEGPKRGGLGLGLYIAAEIASAHGGSIKVESSAEDLAAPDLEPPDYFLFSIPVTLPEISRDESSSVRGRFHHPPGQARYRGCHSGSNFSLHRAGLDHQDRDRKSTPWSDAAVAALKAAKGRSKRYVFPGHKRGSHLSNMAIMQVLKCLERTGITVHGFRSTFRDWCAKSTNYPADVAEMALAHMLRYKTEAAYRRGDMFEKRARLMADWARYGSKPPPARVVAIRWNTG